MTPKSNEISSAHFLTNGFTKLSNKKKIKRPGAIVTKLGLCLVAGSKVTQEVRFVM